MCVIPFPLSHFWKHFPGNCGPLSDTRAAGKPYLLKMLVSWLIITLEVVVRRGMASDHLVARSIQVSRNLKPPVAVEKGPMRSMATLFPLALRPVLSLAWCTSLVMIFPSFGGHCNS